MKAVDYVSYKIKEKVKVGYLGFDISIAGFSSYNYAVLPADFMSM